MQFLHQDEEFKEWLVLYMPPEILVMYHQTYLYQKKHQPVLILDDPISDREISEFEQYLNKKQKKC